MIGNRTRAEFEIIGEGIDDVSFRKKFESIVRGQELSGKYTYRNKQQIVVVVEGSQTKIENLLDILEEEKNGRLDNFHISTIGNVNYGEVEGESAFTQAKKV